MNIDYLKSIKQYATKTELINLYEDGVLALQQELQLLLLKVKEMYPDFVIEELELQITALNEDIKYVISFLEEKHGKCSDPDNIINKLRSGESLLNENIKI